ncbi:MAG: 2-dehydropantoate 2-reductase, partial [Oxalobacteraceae bacterium]
TEVDFINGHAVRKARAHGLPAPLNQAVVHAVHALEAGRTTMGPQAIEALAAQVRSASTTA